MTESNAGGGDPTNTDPIVNPDPNVNKGDDPNADKDLETINTEFEKSLEDKSPEEITEAYKEHNKQLFGRAKSAEGKYKDLKDNQPDPKKVDPVTPPADPQPKPTDKDNKLSVDDVLGLQAEGYSPVEIKDLQDQAIKMGVPLNAYLGNEIIKAGVEQKRKEREADDATPSPSNKAPLYDKKEWKDLDDKEKDTKYGEHVKGIVDKKKGR